MSAQPGDRKTELRERLEAIRARVAAAATAAGRAPDEISLIAVTKLFPVSDIRVLADLGVTDIGESRDQEARAKAEQCADLPELDWHFVGQVQTNKARSVARYADVVHSVDRLDLVTALGRGASAAGRTLRCLVQVRLDGRAGRGGALPEDVRMIADAVVAAPALRLGGVMAVAPLHADPHVSFARLEETSRELRRGYPEATWISAGMSADFETAIEHGTTHVRVGRVLLGERPTRR